MLPRIDHGRRRPLSRTTVHDVIYDELVQGIVTDPETFSLLKRRTITVWLRTEPEEHWNRVVAQGDQRPMVGRPTAMIELDRLWKEREPLYAQADHVIETSLQDARSVAHALRDKLGFPVGLEASSL